MEKPDLLLDSQMLDEARLHMQMREYSQRKKRFASAPSKKPPGTSFWIETVHLPSASPDNSSSPSEATLAKMQVTGTLTCWRCSLCGMPSPGS